MLALCGADGDAFATKLSALRRLRDDPNARRCPNPSCGHVMTGRADAPDMACPKCATAFCFVHDLQHAGRPCAHYLEDQSKAQRAAERAERRLTEAELLLPHPRPLFPLPLARTLGVPGSSSCVCAWCVLR